MFRLQCRHCKRIAIADVGKWSSMGGRAICPFCDTDWGDAGQALALLMAGLRTLCVTPEPDVLIQAEIASPQSNVTSSAPPAR